MGFVMRERRGGCEEIASKGLYLDEESYEVVATNEEGAKTVINSSISPDSVSAGIINENNASSFNGRSGCEEKGATSGSMKPDDPKSPIEVERGSRLSITAGKQRNGC